MKIIVDDLAVEYRDEGQGPTLLMLHGWGNRLEYFDTLCAQLEGFRIVRLDLPGFGSSETPREKEGWTVERYARFVSAFCRKLRLEPDSILGHSLGGRILIKGAGRDILHPKRIVFIAAAGIAKRRTARNLAYAAAAKIGKFILAPLPSRMYERFRAGLYTIAKSDYTTVWSMSPTFLNMAGEDLSSDAALIQVPTLIIWGARDIVTPILEGEKLHELVVGSTLRVIPDAGHFVYQEHPQEVAKLIREFV